MKTKQQATNTKSFDKLPSSKEIEEVVLGMLMIESHAIHEVSDILSERVFFYEQNATIYEAIKSISEEGNAPDMMLVYSRLSKNGKLESVGGPFYLTQLVTKVASSANLVEHSLYLKQLYIARSLVVAGGKIMGMAYDTTLDVEDTLYEGLKMLESITGEITIGANTVDLSALSRKSMELYHERKESRSEGKIMGILTGLSKLDKTVCGLKGGQLVILAARPAMGKTAFALHVAMEAAKSGNNTVVFSLEMPGTSLADRMLISTGDLNAAAFRSGTLVESEEKSLYDAVGSLSQLPITIEDTSGLSVSQIKSIAKNLQRKGKCNFIVIDYLQLIDMKSENKFYSREQEVSQCTRELKMLAKSLDVPVLLLSQLSRKCEERNDKTPILSDLRESGSIEQDADIVLMIHRPEYYDKMEEKGTGIIRIAKHRDGRTGDIKFKYNKSLTKFFDYDIDCPF